MFRKSQLELRKIKPDMALSPPILTLVCSALITVALGCSFSGYAWAEAATMQPISAIRADSGSNDVISLSFSTLWLAVSTVFLLGVVAGVLSNLAIRGWLKTASAEGKRARRDSQEAERARLIATLAAGEVSTWDYDLVDDRVWGDRPLGQMFGIEAKRGSSRPLADYIEMVHDDDRDHVMTAIRQVAIDRNEYHAEFRTVESEGRLRWLLGRGRVDRNHRGEAVKLSGVVLDITALKAAQAQLELSETRFKQIAEALPQLVWVTDAEGKCEYVNQRWVDYTGCGHEDSTVQTCQRLLYPETRSANIDLWQRSLRSGNPYENEQRLRSAGGEYRWFLVRALPMRNRLGEPTQWFGTCTDIEDSKRLAADLTKADRLKDEFLATLAHELRNPLAPIRNGLQIMQRAEADSPMVPIARDMMERQVKLMVRLVDDLLEVSRISRGKIELCYAQVDFREVIERSIETSWPAIEAAGHEVPCDLPSQPLLIQADALRLIQVISNLLHNASKYSEPGKAIKIVSRQVGNTVWVSIKDEGIGISAEMMPKIFDMFAQAERTLGKTEGGLGIGLTLVKQLVEMHGGSVRAMSAGEGKGSEFVLQIPVSPEHRPLSSNIGVHKDRHE